MELKASNYHDFSGLADLRREAKANNEAAIEPVARQFEALFLQMMLKSMRDGVQESGLLSSDGGDMYREMYDKQLAVTLAEQGGIGMADGIVRQLSGSGSLPAISGEGSALQSQLLRQTAAADGVSATETQANGTSADNTVSGRGS